MQFTPPLYLDPGSGSFLIQLLVAVCALCGAPSVVIGALLAYFRFRPKKPPEQTGSTDER